MLNLHLVAQGVKAYIDPGALTMLLQVLIAGAITGLFMLKVFWGKVKAFFIRLFARGND